VELVAADIKRKSPIIRKEVAAGKVKIAGGYYSISAGRVESVSF
jgi:carbonic anhydrase